MVDKYQNKYRISSARLQNWDYGSNAAYFVTICTQNREYFFGKIINGQMQLSEIGEIAQNFWHEIPLHFPFIQLDEFVVMPNHVHGIIIIAKPDDGCDGERGDDAAHGAASVETPDSGVPTNTNTNRTMTASKKWKPGVLGVIINQYKRAVTINARKTHADFAWQPRFHDHIIRNDESFQRIKNYIFNNPSKWAGDKFYNKYD